MHLIRKFINVLRSDCFDRYKEAIILRNRDTVGKFALVGCLVALIAAVSNFLIFQSAVLPEVLLLLLYFSAMGLLYAAKIRKMTGYMTLILYLLITPILLIAAYMGTFADNATPAHSFMVLIIALPVFILDRPLRLSLYIIAMCAAFAVWCHAAKSDELFMHDMMRLVSAAAISIGLALFVVEERIESITSTEHLSSKSEHDPLTGIYNRGGDERISELIRDRVAGTFILMDIDDFKHVNDNYGHAEGDSMLREVSAVLSSSFRAMDVVMRMGGDEFIVYAPAMVDFNYVNVKMKSLLKEMREINRGNDKRPHITVSFGCVINDGSYTEYDALFNAADHLLYEVKRSGKNNYRLLNRSTT